MLLGWAMLSSRIPEIYKDRTGNGCTKNGTKLRSHMTVAGYVLVYRTVSSSNFLTSFKDMVLLLTAA
jgi:hypothetical protein